jgi:hypothetical protein
VRRAPARAASPERAALWEVAERRELAVSAEPQLAASMEVLALVAERVTSAEPQPAASAGVLAELAARPEVARRGTPAWMPPPSTLGRTRRMPVAKVSL